MAEELYGGGGGGGVAGAFTAGASSGGNTAGTTGTVSNGVLFFGGANITLSESSGAGGASLSIVGAAGAAFSAGVSSGGNSAGTTGTVGNGIRFFGGNSITLSQSSAAGGATISVVGPSAWSQSAGMSNLGNTVGTTGIASGSAIRYLLAGGNNITLSQSINGASGTVTISGPNAQTGISGIAGSAASTVTAGTIVFANSNSMSFGLNGSTMTGSFSVTNTAPPIATAVKGVSSIGSTGTVTRFAPEDHQHAGVFSFGVSSGGNTSGNTTVFPGQFVLAGGNNITLSQATAAGNLATITISGGAGGAFTGGVSSGGNTAGTTGTVNNGILFVGGNNITLSQSSAAGGATVTISAPSGGGIGVSSGGNTAGTTGTVDFQMVFVGSNNITLSQSINGSSGTISVIGASGGGIAGIAGSNASTVTNGTVQFANSNNITFGLNGSTITASASFSQSVQPEGTMTLGASNLGNTAGTSGVATGTGVQFAIVGSNNITLSQSINGASGTISIIGGAGGAFSGGVSTVGNTSGDTKTVGSQLVFAGTNNITLSQSTNGASATVIVSGPTGGGAGMGSTGNTFGTSGTVGAELYLYGSNNISLSQSLNAGSASLTIIGPPLNSRFFFFPEGATSSVQQSQNVASYQVVQIPYDITFSRVDIPIFLSLSSSGTAATGNIEISSGLVIYSISATNTFAPIAGSFGTTTHTWASNTANFSSITGPRLATFGIATSLSRGLYGVGFQMSTNNNSSIGTATTQLANTVRLFVGQVFTATAFAPFGAVPSPTGDAMVYGRGVASSTMTATNATQGITNITQTGASKLGANFQILFRNY